MFSDLGSKTVLSKEANKKNREFCEVVCCPELGQQIGSPGPLLSAGRWDGFPV